MKCTELDCSHKNSSHGTGEGCARALFGCRGQWQQVGCRLERVGLCCQQVEEQRQEDDGLHPKLEEPCKHKLICLMTSAQQLSADNNLESLQARWSEVKTDASHCSLVMLLRLSHTQARACHTLQKAPYLKVSPSNMAGQWL